MTTRLALCSIAVALCSGCASVVPYTPNQRVLDEVGVSQAASLLETTLARAAEPEIVSARCDEESLHYAYSRVVHGPFGIPVGTQQLQMQLFYVNLNRVELYDTHYVYLYGPEDRYLNKVRFATAADAKSFADLVMSFRARRVYGQGQRPGSEDLDLRPDPPPE